MHNAAKSLYIYRKIVYHANITSSAIEIILKHFKEADDIKSDKMSPRGEFITGKYKNGIDSVNRTQVSQFPWL